MKRHIVYIPGLGDRSNWLRRLGLLRWRRPSTKVTLVPMRWSDSDETYKNKMARVFAAIDAYDADETILVGESAGGSVVITALKKYGDKITRLVTVCGLNHGADDVESIVYDQNPALRESMDCVDKIVPKLNDVEKRKMLTVYSSKDGLINPKHTRIFGVDSVDTKVIGHMLAIGYVLFVKPGLVTNR